VAGGAWPWGLYAPLAARRQSTDTRDGRLLAWTWLALGVILLSVAKSKLVTYLLPVFPPLAILAAVAWQDRQRDTGDPWPGFSVAVWIHAVVGCLIVPLLPLSLRSLFGLELGRFHWTAAIALAAGYAWVLATWQTRHRGQALSLQVGLAAATFAFVMAVAAPALADHFSSRSLARHFNQGKTLPPAIWIGDERLGSIVFYLDPALRRDLTPERIETVPLGFLLGRLVRSRPLIAVVLADRDVPRVEGGLGFNLAGVPFDRAGRHRVYTVQALRERMYEMIGGRDR
jgi:4-amino-4-deoxy-L-arabinose transferase-like glycosyltransferase